MKTEQEKAREAQFMTALRGIGVYHVAVAYSSMSPTIDFRGTSKSLMAEHWAAEKPMLRRRENHRFVSLDLLVRRAKARAANDGDWFRIS